MSTPDSRSRWSKSLHSDPAGWPTRAEWLSGSAAVVQHGVCVNCVRPAALCRGGDDCDQAVAADIRAGRVTRIIDVDRLAE